MINVKVFNTGLVVTTSPIKRLRHLAVQRGGGMEEPIGTNQGACLISRRSSRSPMIFDYTVSLDSRLDRSPCSATAAEPSPEWNV